MAGRSKRKQRPSLQETKESYYNRLLHQCKKALNKQIKLTKTFEAQKIIRKIKNGDNSKEQKLQDIKELANDDLIHEALRRLGIDKLNPVETEQATRNTTPLTPVAEHILSHKKMQACIEHWNEQVTQYHRWCLKREGGVDSSDEKAEDQSVDMSQSLFLNLQEQGTSIEDQLKPKKKNRMGQRARKAKAIALEAKEKGVETTASANWREKKSKPSHDRAERSEKSESTRPTAKQDEILHPSWEARKEQKAGIVAFQGKKITFD